MTLDLLTIVTIAAFASVVSGGLLLASWLQSTSIRALGLWAMSFAGNATGFALFVARGHIPDTWWLLLTGAILAAAHGIMWTGARSFEGRSTPMPLMLAGTLIWLVACQFPAFQDSRGAWGPLMSAIIVAYSVLTAVEFWRGRGEALTSNSLIIALLLGHALIFMIRILFGGSPRLSIQPGEVHINWLTFIFFEAIFYAFSLAYMLGSVAKERIAHSYKRDSLTDPLTGIPNRRGFLQRCEAMLRRTAFEHHSSALLLFDLDNFKSINDTYGHHAGDKALVEFCRVAASVLRPTDIFGRVGGEEFGCLIPHASAGEGSKIAERIRVTLEAARLQAAGSTIALTVSVGVAVSATPEQGFGALMMTADQMLYRAKAKGRNRVESAPLA